MVSASRELDSRVCAEPKGREAESAGRLAQERLRRGSAEAGGREGRMSHGGRF